MSLPTPISETVAVTTAPRPNWHEGPTKWFKSRIWQLFLSLVLIGTLLASVYVLRSIIGSVVSAIAVFLSIYSTLPENWQINLRQNFFLYSTGLTLVLAFMFLTLWLVVNLFWSFRYGLRQIEMVSETEPGSNLEVYYPAVVLADSQPITATLTLTGGSPISETLEVKITWPSSLILDVGPGQIGYDYKILEFDPGQKELSYKFEADQRRPITATLTLANARTLEMITPAQNLNIELFSSLTGKQEGSLPIKVESEAEFNLRTFVNSTVNEKSPLIILIAGLLSGASGLFAQYKQKEKEAEDKKRTRERAATIEERFRVALRNKNLNGAEGVLQEMRALEQYPRHELIVAEKLILLAKDGGSNWRSLAQETRDWADESKAAFSMAFWRILSAVSDVPSFIEEAIPYLPDEAMLDPRLWSQSETLVQPIEWPGDSNIPSPPASDETISFLETVRIKDNPFAYERAEDDQRNLFGRNPAAFWNGHKLFERIVLSSVPSIITGLPGCGRTTLALALGRYLGSRDNLALYLPGQPGVQEIQSGFAQHLLDFAKAHPTLLAKLTTAERTLMTRIFVAFLGRNYASAEVKASQAGLDSAKWLQPDVTRKNVEAEKDKTQKERWRRLADQQLTLLEQEIMAQTDHTDDNDDSWPRELSRCARSLGFKQMTLVLDATSESADWANGSIIPNLRRWQTDKLIADLFLPEAIASKVKVNDGVTLCKRLSWTSDQLVEMAHWRYRAFVGDRANVESLFAPDQFDKWVKKSMVDNGESNPQRLIQLWNSIIRRIPEGKTIIDAEDIESALEAED